MKAINKEIWKVTRAVPRHWDLQRFADGDEGDAGSEGDAGTGDDKTKKGNDTATNRFKDPKSGESVFVSDEVKQLIEHSIGKAKSDVRAETEKAMSTLKKQANADNPDIVELRSKITELEDNALPAKEKERVQAERAQKAAEASQKKIEVERDKFRTDYEGLLVENSINDGLSGHKLFNSKKTRNNILVDSIVELDDMLDEAGKPTGQKDVFLTMMLPDETGAMTRQRLRPKDAITKWIGLPEQANELMASLTPGSGASTPGSGQGPTGSPDVSRKDLANSQEARKQFVKDLKEGKNPKIMGGSLAG